MLKENITRINEYYKERPFYFFYKDEVVRLIEQENYYLNNHDSLKQKLKHKFNLSFSDDLKWHVNEKGMSELSSKVVKLETSLSFQELKRKLYKYIHMVENKYIREGIANLLNNNPIFFKAPGSLSRHHSYKHGLLEHSLQVIEFSLASANTYEMQANLDMDLLISAALVHDIGKCSSYKYDDKGEAIAHTMMVKKQKHMLHGCILLDRYFNHDGISNDFMDDLYHIIASHHTIKDWDAITEPMTPEAWIIALSDNLSSKIGG